MTDTSEKVLIETSLDHAQALSRLLDLSVRIHLGQIEEIADLARMGQLNRRPSLDATDVVPMSIEESERLEEALQLVKGIFGHPRNGSFGIGAPGVSLDAKRGYEIKKAVDKALHMHSRPNDLHSVSRDGVTVRYAPGDAPTATVKAL